MLPRNEHQNKTLKQRKTRLAVQKERARLGMCNLRQRRRVEEPREQRKTRLEVDRENKKEAVSRNYQSNAEPELMLKEKVKR